MIKKLNAKKNKLNIIDGLIVLNKPKNFTSNDCIQVIKTTLHPTKIGHTGTLDVNATGVLVCLLGKGTKCQDYLMKNGDKVYDAELIIGISTDTEDFTGITDDGYKIDINSIKKICDVEIDNKLKDAIDSFIGEYNQIPPMYSAKKIDGKKLINLARNGVVVNRNPVKLMINKIDIINSFRFNCIGMKIQNSEIEGNIILNKEFDLICINLRINCSKGTYIRTLCKDIGEKIGLKSCMGNLNRITSGPFDISESIKLEDIKIKTLNNDLSFVKPCLYQENPSVLTFGKFETLHLGHQKIINEIVKVAKAKKLDSTVLLIGNTNSNILSDTQRISKLNYWGVNNILTFPYNEWTMKMTPYDFVKSILISQLKAKVIVVGSDCSFGNDAYGDIILLKDIVKDFDIEVIVVDKIKIPNSEEVISSTRINKAFNENDFDLVNELLYGSIE